MLFQSSLLGPVEVDENTVLHFPAGLPGLEGCTRFKLFHEENDNPRVFWMQSLDDADILFSVVDAQEVAVRYEIELTSAEIDALQLKAADDAAVLVIVYKDGQEQTDPMGKLRANLRSPLVINLETRVGLQKVGLNCDIVFRS